jgi:predicted TPR repeat methyltransferase
MILSRGAEYFEKLYAANPDPWDFETSAYERDKYQATLEMLSGQHFRRAFEVGCSIGVLTKLLAEQCDSLLAVDMVESALAAARARCAGLPHVTFANRQIPTQWPDQEFDLILFSEVLYFLTPADITRTALLAAESTQPGAIVLLVNYTEKIDEPCGGDEAADCFITAIWGHVEGLWQFRSQKFRIDLMRRRETTLQS